METDKEKKSEGTPPESLISLALSSNQKKFQGRISKELSEGHYRLAKLHYDKADLPKAEQSFVAALHYRGPLETLDEMFSAFKILGFLVRINSEKLDAKAVERYITDSERLLEAMASFLKADQAPKAEYLYNLGSLSLYRGNFKKAEENFFTAFEMALREGEDQVRAKALYALATCAYHEKNYTQALNYLQQLSDLMVALNKNYLRGTLLMMKGNILSEQGHFEKALEHYKAANSALHKKSCWNLYPYILLSQGNIHKKKGAFKRALLYFDLAKEVVDRRFFRRFWGLVSKEVEEVNDHTVDLYLDRTNRMVFERSLGAIDFKHRFVLLEILFLLAQNVGKYYDKDELARNIWKDEYNPLIHDKLIYTSVSRLRKLIEPKGEKRKYIIRGKDGYAFNELAKTRFQANHDLGGDPLGHVELGSPV